MTALIFALFCVVTLSVILRVISLPSTRCTWDAVSVCLCVGMELESIHKFLAALGVQRLTECLCVVPQTELYKPCPTLQAYVRQMVPWIQKQLYTEFSDTYNFLVESGIKARLAVMRFAEVCFTAYFVFTLYTYSVHYDCLSPSPLLDNIWVMVIVWRLRGNIIRTALCWIVWHNVHSLQHTYVSSSYRSNRLGLSHWDCYAVCRGGCPELYVFKWESQRLQRRQNVSSLETVELS